jgi:uncharacterized protein YqfB (UPF0267 family)
VLPIRKVVFDANNPELGLQFISLVADPAIEIDLITLSKTFDEIKIQFTNEAAKEFITPVLIPNQLVYRKIPKQDGIFDEFNLMFDADTIKQIAYQWQKKNMSSSVDAEHSRKLIDGVTFMQTFLTNEKTVSEVKGFEKLPVGTWFLVGQAENEKVVNDINAGVIRGVSIDGLFATEKLQMNLHDAELKNLIQKVYTNNN